MVTGKWRPWVVLLAIGLAARILPATVHNVIGTDEGLFLTLAQSIEAGGAYTANGRVVQADFPPGFPLFAAAVYRLGGGLELPSLLNTLLIGGLLPLPVYWLARQLVGAKAGFRAGLFTALLPALALATANFEATAEPLYSLLLYTGWAVLWWALSRAAPSGQPTPQNPVKLLAPFLLAGLIIGAAHLVRWEGVILGLVGAALIVFSPWLDEALRNAESLGHRVSASVRLFLPASVFLIGLAAFAAPYALFLHRHSGMYVNPKTTITRLHAALLDASKTDPYAFERYYYDLEDVLADPVNLSHVPPELLTEAAPLPRRYLANLLLQVRLWLTTFSLMFIVWIIPAVIGAWALRWRRLIFVAALFVPLAAIPAAVVDPRYFLPALPAAMILAAGGWEVLETRLPRLRLAGRTVPLATVGLAGTLALYIAFTVIAPFQLPRPVEYRRAGLALRGQLPEGAHMLARKRQAPFYAGVTWEWLPFDELPGVLDYAASKGADYILLDARTAIELRPQLAYLLDPAQAPAELQLIYRDEPGGVVVYRIVR